MSDGMPNPAARARLALACVWWRRAPTAWRVAACGWDDVAVAALGLGLLMADSEPIGGVDRRVTLTLPRRRWRIRCRLATNPVLIRLLAWHSGRVPPRPK